MSSKAAAAKAISAKVAAFWFQGLKESAPVPEHLSAMWFGGKDSELDMRICEEFMPITDQLVADNGLCQELCADAEGTVSAIVLLDQFPRNAFRGTPKSFSYDSGALALAKHFVDKFSRAQIHPVMKVFAYMPFEHSESATEQDTGLSLFADLLEECKSTIYKVLGTCCFQSQLEGFLAYAKMHKEIIDKYGRFPHRNSILGRQSTPDELAYMQSGGQTFGTKK